MTTDMQDVPRRHIHEAVLYASDDELLAVVVPFLREGRNNREPTLAVLDDATTDRVRGVMGDTAGVGFLGARGRDANPARVLRTARDVLASHVADGAERIRVVATIPHGADAQWDWWARYENAVNRAFAAFPLWNLCPYDLRTIARPVLDDVLRTHPRIVTVDGSHANPRCEEPDLFLRTRSRSEPDLVQSTAPLVDLVDPSAASARRAVRHVGEIAGLAGASEDDLVIAVSETVSNGLVHGTAPVRLRLWLAPGRVVATVDDAGVGPLDPLAGLLPTTETSSGGIGLWLTHRVCNGVVLSRTAGGFTVRMTMDLGEWTP
jgi:anti-sigma regulatory factor (Ser/Thr protein kinase)